MIKAKSKSKKVMVFGTFDLLHEGHFNFFKQAKKKGDYLIVVVARDVNVKKNKNYLPEQKEKSRLHIVKHIALVSKALLGDVCDYYKAIKKYRPDVICFGYDQKVNAKEVKEKLTEFCLSTKICRLKPFYPEVYKSSIIKKHHSSQL